MTTGKTAAGSMKTVMSAYSKYLRQNLTVILNSLKSSEDAPLTKVAWSKFVTQLEVFVVPKKRVGANEARGGSYDPISTEAWIRYFV